jgi:hypothetical protein
VAVEEQLKSNRALVFEKLSSAKFSKHFLRSDKATIFRGRSEAEKPQTEETTSMKSPEVEKVKKVLNFDDKNRIKCVKEDFVFGDSSKDKKPTLVKDQNVKFHSDFRVTECLVSLKRLKPQKRYIIDKNLARKDCFVRLKDARSDSKLGPKVLDILGIKGSKTEQLLETKSELLELDINKNLSPKSVPKFEQPAFSSTPTKPCSKPANPIEPTQLVKEDDFDLLSMKKRLDEGAYANVLDFHLDVKRLRDSAKIGGPAKKSVLAKFDSTYEKAMAEVCPWFNLKNPTEFHEPEEGREGAVSPPTSDHVYSVKVSNNSSNNNNVEVNPELNLVSLWKSKYQTEKERRFCALCGKLGDAAHDRAGRLLYFRQNEWVHVG